MFVHLTSALFNVRRLTFAAVLAVTAFAAGNASAQWPSTRIVSPGAGGYQHLGGGVHHNQWNGSTYVPGVGAYKPHSGNVYRPLGNTGYYQSAQGNIYNPGTGSYTQGKHLTFRPGNYHGNGFFRHNPTTGSTHIPGLGAFKSSGYYAPMGNGYYQNQSTGNVYNPSTGAYKFR